jgi:Flp pilus assembly protein CpaB
VKLNRKRVGIIFIVVGLVVAIGVGAVVYLQMEQATEIAKRTPVVEVVVAVSDLPERVVIPPTAIKVMKVPVEMASPQAATKLEDVVGKYPLTRIYSSEIVFRPKLANTAGMTAPAFALEEGMVATTLAGSDLLNGTGAIRAGDRVDMLISLPLPAPTTDGTLTTISAGSTEVQTAPTIPLVSQKMLQNLEVLRVGSFPGVSQTGEAGSAQSTGKSITFQVSHQDAVILKWAKDSGGTIDLILRHPADREPVNTEPIALDYVFRQFNFTFAEGPVYAPTQ